MSFSAGRSSLTRLVSGFLGICALALLLSLGLRTIWPSGPGFVVGAGRILSDSFAWAAAYVPVWIGLLALLVILPGFHPRSLYLLTASLLPFIVLSAFARLESDPAAVFERHPVLAAAGLPFVTSALMVAGGLALAIVAFGFAKVHMWARGESPGRSPRGVVRPPKDRSTRMADGEAEDQTQGAVYGASDEAKALHAVLPRPARGGRTRRTRAGGFDPETIDPERFDLRLPRIPPRLTSPPIDDPDAPFGIIGGEDESTAAAVSHPRTVAGAASAAGAPRAGSAPGVASETPSPGGFDAEELTMLVDAHAVREAGAHTLKIPGTDGIEFHSVPPQHRQDGDSLPTGKEHAVARLLSRKKNKHYFVPVDGILNAYPDGQYWVIDDKTRSSAEVLRNTLAEFGIQAEVTGIRKGPVITMFEILPAPGVKLSKITNLGDNIALRLAASSVRIVAPIPGKHAVGIEVPNERRAIVSLREIVDHDAFKSARMEMPVVLGKDIAGEVKFIDLASTPHLLIAGATGSGKSVCVNTIILSILYRRSPEEVRLLLIDPKIVELKLYNDIPHLLTPVITEPKRAFQALQYCISEMERRYTMLDNLGVRDIRNYNRRVKEKELAQERLPYIVVIVDEFADLMATTGKELEATLARLAAMSRAVGIHLVLATQRPSIDVITGLIKANIPTRIAFMVAGKFDSRIIIDMVGAEKLLGRGDMLFSGAADPFPVRIQGAFVSDDEVEKAVAHVRTLGEPEYIDDEIFYDEDDEESGPSLFDDGEGDPLFEKALEIVLQQGKASASYIQRRLKIGYNRAARLVELMESRGIVGPAQGSRPRDLVRNPDVTGRNMTGDSPGRIEASPSRRGDPDGEPGHGGAGGSARRRDLMGSPETLPGQRVTGRDED